MRASRSLLAALPLLAALSASPALADDTALDPGRITKAVTAGLKVLERGTVHFAETQTCFTCHHQTLPMLAQVTAREHGFRINEDLLQQQARFTRDSFASRLDRMRRGTGIGGRSMTIGYALWALDLAGWEPDEVTEAMAAFLIATQEDSGRFFTNPSRPPLEDSPATSAALAAYYLQKFATDDQKPAAAQTAGKAKRWLEAYQPERQEDRNARLWGLHLLGADEQLLESARRAVLETQREDGGWAQLPGMESDSYATGQALWMLHETGLSTDKASYRRGLAFLLDTQLDDGSWLVKTRSKPIQTYFESGFPHGTDQFISICGTSWAVAALAAAHTPEPSSLSP